MILRSVSKFMTVALIVPLVLANTACSGKAEKSVRGLNPNERPESPVLPQETELSAWQRTFGEADLMFNQAWAKLLQKPDANISSPFSFVLEAIKDTIARDSNHETIDCGQHRDGTEFLEVTGAPELRVIRKITCLNKKPFNQNVVRLQKVSGNGWKWEFEKYQLEKELGPTFIRRGMGKQFIVCDATIKKNDGLLEMLKCDDLGRDLEKNSSEYAFFDVYRYQRSGSRVLSVKSRLINATTNAEERRDFILPVKGEATLTIIKPEVTIEEDEVKTVDRLVPETPKAAAVEGAVPAANPTGQAVPVKEGEDKSQVQPSDKAKQAAKLTPEQLAEEQEMDKVIAEHCTEKELEFVKKQVHSKAEIADSCAAGEIIKEEVNVDQLPSAR